MFIKQAAQSTDVNWTKNLYSCSVFFISLETLTLEMKKISKAQQTPKYRQRIVLTACTLLKMLDDFLQRLIFRSVPAGRRIEASPKSPPSSAPNKPATGE